MSQDLDDIINDLWTLIVHNREGADRYSCGIYLRSTCQKHLFAESRLESLAKYIEEYTQKWKSNEVLDRLYIEMDFDHCILSLRSSLGHLAQLINAIIPLNLSPKVIKGETHVTLKNVIEKIEQNDLLKNNKCLTNLSSYLNSEMEKNWYRDLHNLRITMFHDKFDHLTRATSQTLDRQLLNLKFRLPSGTAKSLVTEEERDIISYCKDVIKKVESVLKESFDLLSKYLSK